jgi:hypothetical protein
MSQGGGIYCTQNESVFSNNIIHSNSASGGTAPSEMKVGGGMMIFAYTHRENAISIRNCFFYDNQADDYGGAIYMIQHSEASIESCTLTQNEASVGGGVYCGKSAELTVQNSIFWDNNWIEIYYGFLEPTVTYTNIEGGWPGVGNLNEDPLFADPLINDFHLQYTSPCRNAGNNAAPGLEETDFEGDPRIAENTVDLGADEFHTHLYALGHLVPGGYVEVKLTELPGTAPITMWASTDLLDPPATTQYGTWYLAFPLLFEIGLGMVPNNGMIVLHMSIPSDIPTPVQIFLQALSGDKLTNLCTIELESGM